LKKKYHANWKFREVPKSWPEPKHKFTFRTYNQAYQTLNSINTMAAPFFKTVELTMFIKRAAPEDALQVTFDVLIKAATLPRKNVAKALTKALLPVTKYVHPDKLDEDDKSLGEALFKSMRNPATGDIYKEIRSVTRADDWFRNAWVTAVVHSLGLTPDTQQLDDKGIKVLDNEAYRNAIMRIREDRQDDDDIVNAGANFQAMLNKKFAKKQVEGNMCTDSEAIVVYTNTFLTGAIDKLRVGGVSKADKAELQRDIFAAVSHITSELNTPTRTKVNAEGDEDSDTESEDDDVPMTEAKEQSECPRSSSDSPAATLKRSRDESDSDISVGSSASSTKRARKARKSIGRGTPIADLGSNNSQLPRMLNVVSHWALSLKADNPARKCEANEKTSKCYLTTISKVFQRNFPMEGTIDQESIEELTKQAILQDQVVWPKSVKNGDQKAHMRKLCAWARFQEYVSSLDVEEFEALMRDLPMTERRTKDVRFIDLTAEN